MELDPTKLSFNLGDANIGRVTEDCVAQTFLIPNRNPTPCNYKIDAEDIQNSLSYNFQVSSQVIGTLVHHSEEPGDLLSLALSFCWKQLSLPERQIAVVCFTS